jgi:bacterioferritin-associated ferredoxin
MYVCVCKGLSERDLLETLKKCGPSLREVQNSCGAATDCGACLERVEKYLNHQPSTASRSPVEMMQTSR